MSALKLIIIIGLHWLLAVLLVTHGYLLRTFDLNITDCSSAWEGSPRSPHPNYRAAGHVLNKTLRTSAINKMTKAIITLSIHSGTPSLPALVWLAVEEFR